MKKQYKIAIYQQSLEGFAVLLDGRAALTPLGAPYHIKSEALAKAIAQEWQAQGDIIRKETMPMTQVASVALDLAAKQRREVYADALNYINTDLVCYRAGDTPDLHARQRELLDPILDWAQQQFGIMLKVTGGVMPIGQDSSTPEKITRVLETYDDWKLAALAVAAKPLCSVILALALTQGRIDGETAFTFSQLEETYETEKWGRDDEKDARIEKLRAEILSVERYLSLLEPKPM